MCCRLKGMDIKMRTLKTKPYEDGFYMPAEFSEHRATLIFWPERRDVWRNGARPVQRVIKQLATIISKFEKVIVGVTRDEFLNARSMLPEDVSVFEISYDDAWIRDTAPAFVTNGKELRGVDWEFNAWGGLNGGSYFPWMLDNIVPQKVLEWLHADRYKASITLEGGAIQVDGEGTLIAIKDCILNPNRNPNMDQTEVEQILSDYLGVKKFIWLEKGLYLEENNGHIDNMCSFIRPGEVFLTWTENINDPQYERSYQAYEILSKSVDAKGRSIKVNKLNLPKPLYITEKEADGIELSEYALPRLKGDRLPASYLNFYFVNGGVIVPRFNCEEDELALAQFKKVFTERVVVQLDAREILLGGGGLHCMTMQIPMCSSIASTL